MTQTEEVSHQKSSVSAAPQTETRSETGAIRAELVVSWLLNEARHTSGRTTALLSDFAQRLLDAGIPVHRLSLHVRQLHPQFAARTLLWLAESGGSVETDRAHGVQNTDMFLRSPVRPIYEGGGAIRRRLRDSDCEIDYPVLADLRDQGYTDYSIRPLLFSGGLPAAIGFSTKHAEGFSEAHLAAMDSILPAFAAVLELQEQRRMARLLLDTYIGRSAGDRVLGGAIRRGYGEVIPAAIWYCDLRGFSSLSEQVDLNTLIATLNDYFDHMAKAIDHGGGEILKFVGDGILAIFPIGTGENASAIAAAKALRAADRALEELDALNETRAERSLPEIRYGISMHVGDVMYGNVGAEQRLDFTVIGPAVNLACRLEDLSRDVEPPLVLSAEFAALSERPVKSLGHFELKGIGKPREAFTLSVCKVQGAET